MKREKCTFLGERNMAKKKVNKGKLVSVDVITNKCKDCGKEYDATKTVYENHTLITPPRCPDCQTAHVTNGRVNKTIKEIKLLGNLKARLSDVQRTAVIDVITISVNELLDRYSGSTVKASAFDLKKVKA